MTVLGQAALSTTALGELEFIGYAIVLDEEVNLSDIISKMPILTFSQPISTADAIIKSSGKLLSDSVLLSDLVSKSVSRILTETQYLSDVFSRVLSWQRVFTETVVLTDTVRKSLSRLLSEIIYSYDVIRKIVVKPLPELVTLGDYFLRELGKLLVEQAILTDVLTRKRKLVSRRTLSPVRLQDIIRERERVREEEAIG